MTLGAWIASAPYYNTWLVAGPLLSILTLSPLWMAVCLICLRIGIRLLLVAVLATLMTDCFGIMQNTLGTSLHHARLVGKQFLVSAATNTTSTNALQQPQPQDSNTQVSHLI
eukprot:CAMPEP_0116823760 /NCGR_PEP_ID=MMETSP0418-20121206/1021_1 /TAXON_ID=1158023 /ORGANISM="Astrosyne radiata, Strain 13vi08-1A" /LENGTH=111 /DNA_ID=CAMNT_0004452057 /DNA_START=40 /DNA_END=375 /DNA_ORIENTATION=-